jgi:hypothetical protein
MEGSSAQGTSRGGLGKSIFDKKPLGERFGNKNVSLIHSYLCQSINKLIVDDYEESKAES